MINCELTIIKFRIYIWHFIQAFRYCLIVIVSCSLNSSICVPGVGKTTQIWEFVDTVSKLTHFL